MAKIFKVTGYVLDNKNDIADGQALTKKLKLRGTPNSYVNWTDVTVREFAGDSTISAEEWDIADAETLDDLFKSIPPLGSTVMVYDDMANVRFHGTLLENDEDDIATVLSDKEIYAVPNCMIRAWVM